MKNSQCISPLQACLLVAILPLTFLSNFSFAEDRSPLLFPLAKNQAQILPQSFEFEILGKSAIRIGDVLLNAKLMRLKFIRTKSGDINADIKIPGGLIANGDFIIRSLNGKVLHTEPVNLADGQKLPMQRSAGSRFENLRFEVTGISLKNFPKKDYAEIKKTRNFQFCIEKKEKLTSVSLCSGDLTVQDRNLNIQVVNTSQKSDVPESKINDQVVGPQGVIYLQDPFESILAVFEIGKLATLRFSTKFQPLDLRIAQTLPERKKIQIQGRGVEVSDVRSVIEQNPQYWVVELNYDRPIIYLRGEAQIPLKQEFVILNDKLIPPEVDALTKWPAKTYSASTSVVLDGRESLRLEAVEKDSLISAGKETQRVWKVAGLKKGQPEKRLLKILDGKYTWIAQGDFERGRRILTEFQLGSALMSQIRAEYWLNTRWGLELQNNYLFRATTALTSWNQIGIQGIYRWERGFVAVNPTTKFHLGYQIINLTTPATNNVGSLSGAVSSPTIAVSSYVAPNWKLAVGGAVGSSSSVTTLDLKNYLWLDSHYEFKFRQYSNWQLGLKLESYSLSVNQVATSWTRPQGYIGISSLW